MAKRSAALVHPKSTKPKNQVPSGDPRHSQVERSATHAAESRAGSSLASSGAAGTPECAGLSIRGEVRRLGVGASMLRLRDIDEEICIAGGERASRQGFLDDGPALSSGF